MAEGENNSPTGRFWSMIGAVSGGAMGFIIANVPGAIAGTVAGNRLGAVRDNRGKSVYSVYQELDQPAKMRLLSELSNYNIMKLMTGLDTRLDLSVVLLFWRGWSRCMQYPYQ
jgi:hypothetical protein